MSDILLVTEKILLSTYEAKGFLTEDEVIDICIDNDLDLFEIDAMCERLIEKRIIIRDEIARTQDEDIVDRSQFDYEALYRTIHKEYPECDILVNEIKNIMPPQTREWNNLIGHAQGGNSFAKERLVLMYLRTVLKQSYDFAKSYYCDFEEAFQYGVIGLINAIEKYDVTSPDTFVSYFPLWVRQNMQRYSEIKGAIIRFPAHYKEVLYSIVSLATKNMEEDDIVTELSYLDNISSKEKNFILPYQELYNDICCKDDVEKSVMTKLIRIDLLSHIRRLSDREQQVVLLRYGILDGIEHTLEEIGTELGVTRERVRQIETKALKKLRIKCRSYLT